MIQETSTEMPLSLAVVIPTYRRPDRLHILLDSLHQQIRQPDEIIIACRPDDTDSLRIIDVWQKHSPLRNKYKVAKVFAEGHLPPLIAALHLCESDVFCQIDDDAVPHYNWLRQIEKGFSDPQVGGMGGKVINNIHENSDSLFNRSKIETPLRLSWFGRSGSLKRSLQDRHGLIEADCFIGCNMAFRKDLLKDSIDYILNGGSAIAYETDVALNVKRKGYSLYYDPEVVVEHYPVARKIDSQRGWNSKECYWYAHNLTYICLKHLHWYGKLAFFVYFFLGGQWGCPGPVTFLLSTIRRSQSVSWKQQFLPAMRGRLEGLNSYYRMIKTRNKG